MKTKIETPAALDRKGAATPRARAWRRASWLVLTLTAHALLTTSTLEAAPNQLPPVVFSVEPEENGKLVYLPIVAETAGDPSSNLFGLRLSMMNNAPDELRLTLIRLRFTFPDDTVLMYLFKRDLPIPGSEGEEEYLSPEESIQLPEPAPASVQIDLFFGGYDLPRTLERELAPYPGPGQGGKYLFPGHAGDLGPDQYFTHVDPHTGGSQFFAYDIGVSEWNGKAFSSVKAGGDANKNEDRVGWNIPIYAMADGVVIRASEGWEDNPVVGQRAIQRMGEVLANPITEVKAATLSETRAATMARRPDQTFEITVWDAEDNGRDLEQRGSVSGETASRLAMAGLTDARLVTAFRNGSGNLRVVVWDVAASGMTVIRRGEQDSVGAQEVSVVRLSNSRFATAVRTLAGTLRVSVWEVSAGGFNVSLLSEAVAGTASEISMARLSSTRFATALRDGQGFLKVIIWDLEDGGATLERRGDATGGLVTKTAAARVSSAQLDTAVRTQSGILRLVRWNVSNDGETVSAVLEAEAGAIQQVALSQNFSSTVLTTVITAGGNLKHILWKAPGDDDPPGLFIRWGEAEGGATDSLDMVPLDTALHFNPIRTASGRLKAITWFVANGGGNSLVLLHGDCRVLYAHFKEGTVNPSLLTPGTWVRAGQFLGRLGNSGSSSGPHLHMHAHRVSSLSSVEEILALEAEGTLPLRGFRPIPFHCARGQRLDTIQPGGAGNKANAFSSLVGQGVYFGIYGIRPTWHKELYVDGGSTCLVPTGAKDCMGVVKLGGPFHTVNQALSSTCAVRDLFIRAGSYPEKVTFASPMIVRSYDGTAIVGK